MNLMNLFWIVSNCLRFLGGAVIRAVLPYSNRDLMSELKSLVMMSGEGPK